MGTLFYAPRQPPDGNEVAEPQELAVFNGPPTAYIISNWTASRTQFPSVSGKYIYGSVCLQLFNYLLDALIQPPLMFYLG